MELRSDNDWMDPSPTVEWIFRVGVAACFIGHGAFGILGKEAWVKYFAVAGVPEARAWQLMPWVGAVDIAVGLLTLFAPIPIILVYMVGWAAWTALLRPLAGESVFEALERAGNYGLPLAFLLATRFSRRGATLRDWFRRVRVDISDPIRRARVVRVLQGTTALLLIGHGGLATLGKPLLQGHLQVVTTRADLLPLLGGLEMALGTAVWFSLHPALLGLAFAWKVTTETLFPISGAPVWEFVERGGSYAAPLALLAVAHADGYPLRPRRWLRGVTLPVGTTTTRAALAVAIGGAIAATTALATTSNARMRPPAPAVAQAQPSGVLEALREGGLILACRHAITDRSRGDARRVRLDDPSTQRVLSQAGREQSRRLGQVLARLRTPIAEVHASPYARTANTAELAFGRVETTETLQYGNSTVQKRGREELLATTPVGGNRVLVSHQGILYRMFPGVPRGTIREGDCLVATPGPPGVRTVLGRFGPEEFAALAQ